jgi:hypothetical protein
MATPHMHIMPAKQAGILVSTRQIYVIAAHDPVGNKKGRHLNISVDPLLIAW